MERVIHTLVQGSDEWVAFRKDHFGASEAAAMFGVSRTTSRNDLLALKKGLDSKEFSAWVQKNILDRGHEIEAAARPIVEGIIGDELYPATYSFGLLSASCDGITMDGAIAFEHKQWNEEYAAEVRSGVVPAEHMPQCQQVMLVSGAEKLIFVISDGTSSKMEHVWVEADHAYHDRLLAGWRQFEADMATFEKVVHPEKAEAAPIRDLPAISFNLDRQTLALTSNLNLFKPAVVELVERSKKKLESDQDFADAEAMVKVLKGAEDKLSSTCDNVLGQIQDVDAFTKDLREISELMRQARLALDKQVKSRKDEIKKETAQNAQAELQGHIAQLNQDLTGIRLPVPAVNFADAMKNKRTIKSLHDAVSEALAAAKVESNTLAGKAKANMVIFVQQRGSDFQFLFRDLQEIAIGSDAETFAALVKQRISDYEREQQERQRQIEEQHAAHLAAQAAMAKDEELRLAQAGAENHPRFTEQQEPVNDNASLDVKPSSHPAMDGLRKVFAEEPAETITITMEEYNALCDKAALLDALQASGVDNWSGYPDAIEMMRDTFADEDGVV